jgi:DNA-binding NarL/FixJ family response regulator
MPIRILLADDHTLFLKGIESLLSYKSGFDIVGTARDGLEAIEIARKTIPDIILMDVDMPRCNGLEAVRHIKREMPQIKIVMLTVSDSSDDLYQSIKAGAQGYLLKDLEPSQLSYLLKGVANGEAALSGLIAAKILEDFSTLIPSSSSIHDKTNCNARRNTNKLKDVDFENSLSEREIEVLELLVDGKSNQEIAQALVITINTVKTHLSNILAKLHLQNRVQLAVYAVRQQLVED